MKRILYFSFTSILCWRGFVTRAFLTSLICNPSGLKSHTLYLSYTSYTCQFILPFRWREFATRAIYGVGLQSHTLYFGYTFILCYTAVPDILVRN